MRAKDLKQAKIYKVKFDKERPLTFDFNTLEIVQENGFIDPTEVIEGLNTMNLKAIKTLTYATLVSGQLAKNEEIEFDLTLAKVGIILGQLMQFDGEHYVKLFDTIREAIEGFFPEPETEPEPQEVESKEKN